MRESTFLPRFFVLKGRSTKIQRVDEKDKDYEREREKLREIQNFTQILPSFPSLFSFVKFSQTMIMLLTILFSALLKLNSSSDPVFTNEVFQKVHEVN